MLEDISGGDQVVGIKLDEFFSNDLDNLMIQSYLSRLT